MTRPAVAHGVSIVAVVALGAGWWSLTGHFDWPLLVRGIVVALVVGLAYGVTRVVSAIVFAP